MIIITGGAGMIGSMIAWHFNAHSQRDDLVLVDRILEADMTKLRAAGFGPPFTELEDGVCDYVRGYLLKDDPDC